MKFKREKLVVGRLVVLLLGVFVSWTTTIQAFINFYNLEGTIFKIKDCVIPNPIVTPCFWGSLAFAGGLVWAYKKYKSEKVTSEKYFFYFMIAANIFAWSNFAIELKGITPEPGALVAPCPTTATSPFLSACFFGSVLFTLSLIATYLLYKKKASPESE